MLTPVTENVKRESGMGEWRKSEHFKPEKAESKAADKSVRPTQVLGRKRKDGLVTRLPES
jgi:hypothetical protein